LRAVVSGEVAHHPRRELGGGDLQDHNSQREDDAEDGERRAGDGEEDAPGAVRAADSPGVTALGVESEGLIGAQQHEGQRGIDQGDHRRGEPETVEQIAL
jgi:hypothetical protein